MCSILWSGALRVTLLLVSLLVLAGCSSFSETRLEVLTKSDDCKEANCGNDNGTDNSSDWEKYCEKVPEQKLFNVIGQGIKFWERPKQYVCAPDGESTDDNNNIVKWKGMFAECELEWWKDYRGATKESTKSGGDVLSKLIEPVTGISVLSGAVIGGVGLLPTAGVSLGTRFVTAGGRITKKDNYIRSCVQKRLASVPPELEEKVKSLEGRFQKLEKEIQKPAQCLALRCGK